MTRPKPKHDAATIRVTRTNSHTEFAVRYRDGDRERFGYLRVLRVFHPIRGEEVRIELEAGRTMTVKSAKANREASRTDQMAAAMFMPPDVVEEFIATLQGKPK